MIDTPQVQAYLPFRGKRAFKNPIPLEGAQALKKQRYAKKLAKVGYNYYQAGLVAVGTAAGIIDFPVPPNSSMRKTGSYSIRKFYESGIRTYLPIVVAALREGVDLFSGIRVLDFGCGVGRQLLHFTRRYPAPSYSTCDIDDTSTEFVARAYAGVETYTNSFDPPLKYADGEFDMVYSVSILSHLNMEDQALWLDELARVTHPGGYCMLTTEGLEAVPSLAADFGADEAALRRELREEGFIYRAYADWEDHVRAQDELRIASLLVGVERSYGNTIVDPEFIRRQWPEHGFQIVEILRGVIDHRQDLVIAQRVGD